MTEATLILEYQLKKNAAEDAEDAMEKHFHDIVNDMLKTAKTEEDFVAIKERIRPMPYCASKVLLFKKILLIQENI